MKGFRIQIFSSNRGAEARTRAFDIKDILISKYPHLAEENYITYKETPSLVKRMEMLEQILTANILSFAKGVGVFYEAPVEVCLLDISEPKTAHYKNVKLLSFDVEFSCNVMLPEFVGLGKGVSKGYGVVNLP